MEPKRILHIVTKMDRAGLETMLMNYYRHIDRSKLQFDFLTHRQEKGDYEDEILALGGRIYRTYPMHPKFFIKYIKENQIFFTNHPEYQVVHSHLDALSSLPLYAAKKAGVPVRIAHSHTTSFDKDLKFPVRILSRSCIPYVATHFWGCGEDAIGFMFGRNIYKSRQYKVVANAIDTSKFRFNRAERSRIRGELKLENKLVIGHVGRFSYPKNHAFLIRIFVQLYQRRPDAILLLVGKGEEEERIRDKVAALGLGHAIRFMGNRDDISQLMQAMDVFVFPSHFEGLSVVLIEAQAAGLPCYTSDEVVSKETKVSDLLQYIPLSQPAEYWAEQIIAGHKQPRQNTTEKIQLAGYDILEQAKKLEEFYCNEF